MKLLHTNRDGRINLNLFKSFDYENIVESHIPLSK